MFKSTLFYVVAALVVGAGGYFIYTRYYSQTTVNNYSEPVLVPAPASSAVGQGNSADELNRRRQEGIGSIKDLKPVEIPPASGK